MTTAIETGLPKAGPFEWAVAAGGTLYTSQVPIRADGTIETGDPEAQLELAFENLRSTLHAAGRDLTHVVQLLVLLAGAEHVPAFHRAYERYFAPPYPNRATYIVGLVVPGMIVELVAYATVA